MSTTSSAEPVLIISHQTLFVNLNQQKHSGAIGVLVDTMMSDGDSLVVISCTQNTIVAGDSNLVDELVQEF